MYKHIAEALASVDTESYKYRLVQYRNIRTSEIFNMGVVVYRGEELRIRVLNNLSAIADCVQIENIEGLKFGFELLQNRINENRDIDTITNSLFLTQPLLYRSEKQIDDVIEEAFERFVSFSKITKHKEINPYSKPKIFQHIKEIYDKKRPDYVFLNKRVSHVHTSIDAVIMDKKHIYLASEVESVYSRDFIKNFAESLMVLNEVKLAYKELQELVMYIPIIEKLSHKQKKNFNKAKEMLRINNIKLLDTKDYAEFIGYLERSRQRLGLALF